MFLSTRPFSSPSAAAPRFSCPHLSPPLHNLCLPPFHLPTSLAPSSPALLPSKSRLAFPLHILFLRPGPFPLALSALHRHLAHPHDVSDQPAHRSKSSSTARASISCGSTGMLVKMVGRKGKRSYRACECRKESSGRVSAASREEAMLFAMKDEGKQSDSEKEKILPTASSTKVFTLPTVLTLGRVAAIPVLLFVFYSNEWWSTAVVASIFVTAAITDWLDGHLARKMGSNSAFGAFLDPVADKLMVATTLVLLCTRPLTVSWATVHPWLIPLPATTIIGREITMSAVREWAAAQGGDLRSAVAVNNLGKWKTASQMVALTVLLATRDVGQNGIAGVLVAIGIVMLYISAGLALWSLVVYMKGIWRVLMK